MSRRRPARGLGLAAPHPPGGEARSSAALSDRLAGLVRTRRVSAIAALAFGPAGTAAAAAGGAAGEREPLFDLASLTKLWTASLALRLDVDDRLPLATPIGELWPRADRELARRPLEALLRHRAGLLPWAPLYRLCRRPERVAELLTGGRLGGARRGTYSDLGFVLWGLSAERALGEPLARLVAVELAAPLGLVTASAPGAGGRRWLVSPLGNGREVELAARQGVQVARRAGPPAGEPQDGNARFLGGVAGHAGLFASPGAMGRLAVEWLRPGGLWPVAAVERALAVRGGFALGWQRATRRGSAGPALAPRGLGHVGFTGGSAWIDRDAGRCWLLLAHRAALDVDLAGHRRWFHSRCRP